MTPSQLRAKVVAERIDWVEHMVTSIRELPLATYEAFTADARTVAAAESYLRRALEALLDLGRHLLAKGFGRPTSEYKEIADGLIEVGVLDDAEGALLREMAGYRNRMVHFYHEISDRELYEICTDHVDDVETILNHIVIWINAHPERIDRAL